MEGNHHPLYKELCGIVGEKYVRDSKMSLIPYSKDMSANHPVMPGAIVRPASTEEVAEIVKLANRTGCPVTLRGGGESANGVTKGIPNRNIVLDMCRLCKVNFVDVENQRVEFGSGIRPSQLNNVLKPYGYFAHTVMGPYDTDSMGGLISGVQGGGYPQNMTSSGLNWHHILGLKVVLPSGEIITTGAGHDSNYMRDSIYYREASSPDLTGLFMSGGGVFGIITEITERIYKLPAVMEGFGYIFNNLDDAWGAMMELSEHVPAPQTNLFLSDTSSLIQFGGKPGGSHSILFSVEAEDQEDLERRKRIIMKACEDHDGTYGDQVVTFLATQGMTGTADVVHETASMVCPFLSLESLYPRSGAKEMLLNLDQQFFNEPDKLKEYGCGRTFYVIPIANYILMGITYHWNDFVPGAGDYMLSVWKRGADLLNKGGSCSAYTQGNNSSKIAEMWTPAYRDLMRNIKRMLDPNNIMCPGLWNL